MRNETMYCDVDRFAITLNALLENVVTDVDGAATPVVRETCKMAKQKVKDNCKSNWKKYPSGFSYTVSKRRLVSVGEVGNKKYPGLVHLLEKGHAKMGGGRVSGYEHVAPAANEAFEYFWDEMKDAVGGAL